MRWLVFLFISVSLASEQGNTALCGNEPCCIDCCSQATEQYFSGLLSPLLFLTECITSCADIVLSCNNLLPLPNLACRLALSMKDPNSPIFTITDSFQQIRSVSCVVSEENPLVGLLLEVPVSPETDSPAPQVSQSPTVSEGAIDSTVSPTVFNDTNIKNEGNSPDRNIKETVLIAAGGFLGFLLVLTLIKAVAHRQTKRKRINILENSKKGEDNKTLGLDSGFEASEVKLMGDDIVNTGVVPGEDVLLVHAHEL